MGSTGSDASAYLCLATRGTSGRNGTAMNETPPPPLAAVLPAQSTLPPAPHAAASLRPAVVRMVVTEPTRLRMLWALSEGAISSIEQMGEFIGCNANMASKHMKVLWRSGVVVWADPPDGDKRRHCYQIPEAFRIRDAMGRVALDFGCVVLRMD